MDEEDEEKILESTDPQITSQIPQERIAARELRIQRRHNASKRASRADNIQAGSEGILGEVGQEDEVGPVERQAVESAALLEHLLADGEEKVTNVRVASDAREVARRFAEAEKQREIITKLEEEANLAEEKFEVISKNWNPILALNDPITINEEINIQKERCNDLIMQKNSLILNLKEEMKLVDETYFADLQKQLHDIKELSERIDDQVLLMRNAYKSQLELIENAIAMERASTIEYNNKRWEALFKKRDKEEITNIDNKIQQVADFEQKMDILTLEHREKFRASKIQLETEVQTLQQELQQLKATCIINSEKIDYNFQVLKRREEENVFVRSQQKRKLNKMQDIMNALKKKIKNSQKDGAAEEAKANKEICRLHDVMLDLQVKAEHFANVNERKYQQLWRMNREKANELIEHIIKTDKIINENILGIESLPNKIKIPKQTDMPSYNMAIEKIQNIDAFSCGSSLSGANSESLKDSSDSFYKKSKNKLVTHILNLVADTSGFLIEERLWPLLKKYESEPVLICKLDNVFSALEIQQEEDMHMLCTYFSKYSYCPICNEENIEKVKKDKKPIPENGQNHEDTKIVQENEIDSPKMKHGDQADYKIAKVIESKEKPASEIELKITKSEQLLVNEVEEIFKDCSYTLNDASIGMLMGMGDFSSVSLSVSHKKMPVTCIYGHDLKVSSVHVLNALQEFVASVVAADKAAKRPMLSKMDTAISRSLKTEDVVMYWQKYKEVFSPQKEKLWGGLLFAFNKYLPILQERQKLNEEIMQLRKQNSDLQHLLRGHIPSTDLPKSQFLSPISKQIRPPTQNKST